MADVIHELIATDVARGKLAARRIAMSEVAQLPRNRHATLRYPRAGKRRLLVGRTNGGRVLTLVIERTLEPTTWMIVTGWIATERERRIIG